MCVIIAVPADAKLPSKTELMAAHTANPHGCGFISSKGKKYKGLDFETFYNELRKVDADESVIIHFRYATHGSVRPGNCHPFLNDGVGFAHNGVLNIAAEKDKTDSQTAFDNLLMPVIRQYGVGSPELKSAVDCIIGGSRFAFMADGKITLYGHYTEVNGRYYSNTLFFAYIPKSNRQSISWDEYLKRRYA